MVRAMKLPVALVVVSVVLAATAAAEAARLTLLHLNDVYVIAPRDGKGGFAPLMTVLKEERAKAGDAVMTTFGGDLILPSILSTTARGAHMIALMNAIGLDAAVPGNHEFDFGTEILGRRIAESWFTWLAANARDRKGDTLAGMKSLMLRKVGAATVGLFGLVLADTARLSKPGPEARFGATIAAARDVVAALRARGADAIVALTHLTLADDRALVRAVPGIGLVLGGHDHHPLTVVEAGVPIVKAGQDAQNLAVVELDITAAGATHLGWRLVPVEGRKPDPAIAGMVKGYLERLDGALAVEIATTSTPLDSRRRTVRRSESTMGNLITDAMRAATGAAIALINGGGIRGNREYAPGTRLTRKDVLGELPFGDLTVVLALDGATLRAALEHAVGRVEHLDGRFLQVSGIAFAWNPAAPPGRRVLRVTVNGAPLAPAATYRVAAGAYIAAGGDGFTMLEDAPRIVDVRAGYLIANGVMAYLAAKGSVAPRLDGRIVEAR